MKAFSQRLRIDYYILAALACAALPTLADPVIGPWIPKFKGIDYCSGTNLARSTAFPNQQVAHALRVDLTDPGIQLFTTPRITNYIAGVREVGGLTVSGFLRTNRLQAAINGNFFDSTGYYVPAGTPMDVYGLAINQGDVVSTQDESRHASVFWFDASNRASVLRPNWPPTNTAGMWTAVAGDTFLVSNGSNMVSRSVSGSRDVNPRTVFGLSQDRRYLYLVAIDGRQPGYSEGANDYESAGWLLLLGAYDGINLDGGGSTTLVIEDTTGIPLRLNQSSAVADSGKERTIASHLGVFAKPLPGFINDVVVAPDDTTAWISWTTIEPATSEVQYGLTTDFGSSSSQLTTLATNHLIQLRELTPNTGYYFRLVSCVNTQEHTSPNYHFVTANYATTNEVFGLTNSWKFTPASLDGIGWMNPGYDDSSWSGPGPGLLWVDVRSTGPNPSVEPKNTEMPADLGTGYPYVTYYFRSHFTLDHVVPGSSVALSGYIDDGAIIYLNGTEIYRLRMPEDATSETLASGYPCSGDATCLDEFQVPVGTNSLLVSGDNLIAVEVHNYNLRSADTTFGIALSVIEPLARTAKIEIQRSGVATILSWDSPGYILQSSEALEGPWTDETAGAISPFTIAPAAGNRFFRLRH